MLMGLNNLDNTAGFEFKIADTSYQELVKKITTGWQKTDRMGNWPLFQVTSQPEEDISLAGAFFPHVNGRTAEEELSDLAGLNEPFMLISGDGDVLGLFVIMSISFKKSKFIDGGRELVNNFQMELSRYVE